METTPVRDSHCPHCGTRWVPAAATRTCERCGETTWRNPLPVSVLIVPVAGDTPGVLAVERTDIPGGIALPGGYCELGETWQQAGCREVREETGVHIDPDRIQLFDVHSTPGTALLIFGTMTGPAVPFPTTFAPASTTVETAGITIATFDTTLCFQLHNQVLQNWFAHHT